MELEEVLRAYEVTRVPQEAGMHLVWSAVAVDAAAGEGAGAGAPIVLLDAYRVSRVPQVPHTAAS